MTHLIKPVAVALKGKGLGTLTRRVGSIVQRYGFNSANMDRALGQLAQILKQFDCRATLPITTVALARNSQVIQKYQAQGIEFAVHGYRHIDHSQLSLDEQTDHFRQAAQIFQQHRIQANGFRSPYLRWNEATLTALSQTGFGYDSSPSLYWAVPQHQTTESYHRVLGFYGAQPLADYPALPSIEPQQNLVQIPYCLPDDESLVERLQWQRPTEMNEVWPTMFQHIHAQGELFNLGLHPERTAECAPALVATLEAMRPLQDQVWRARLVEIAAWWRERTAAVVEATQDQADLWQLKVNGPAGACLLLRNLAVKSKSEPWFGHYRRADNGACTVQTNQRPFIGVSPNSAPALSSFLKQNGYIVETSAEAAVYSFYLDRPTFSRLDERPLLDQIETGDFPLARLGRWPYGARSALCITGDIDALTVWDYSLRFLGH